MRTPIDIKKLVRWFQTPVGQTLLRRQRDTVEQGIARCFGYHQLEFLIDSSLPVGESSLLGHRILAVPDWQPQLPESTVVCQPHEIPLGSDSVDLVILHHTLDISEQPHQTLREASRVVRSGGHIVVTGFNPYSLWGIRRFIERRLTEPWNLRFLGPSRLEDWLNLLDFRVKSTDLRLAVGPASHRWLRRFTFLERLIKRFQLPLGAFYVIIAQKRVGCGIPVAHEWRRRRLVGVATIHPFVPCKNDEKR
jgi:SAM-dependent methyltransferase